MLFQRLDCEFTFKNIAYCNTNNIFPDVIVLARCFVWLVVVSTEVKINQETLAVFQIMIGVLLIYDDPLNQLQQGETVKLPPGLHL